MNDNIERLLYRIIRLYRICKKMSEVLSLENLKARPGVSLNFAGMRITRVLMLCCIHEDF